MDTLIVLENPKRWDLPLTGGELVTARDYLTLPKYSAMRRVRVINLCRTSSYQSMGYYVSLLATARGHRPVPGVSTLQDLRQDAITRIASDDYDDLFAKAFSDLKSDQFELSIYFGRNLAKKYDRLASALYNRFPAPLLRATFVREDGAWTLEQIRSITLRDVPDEHKEFVAERVRKYVERPLPTHARGRDFRYELAILADPHATHAPSDKGALDRFVAAARTRNINAYIVGRDEYARIGEYDGLFIRETTAVNHHTYRFARRAAAQGLVVIDDPESIIRCTNKVYQAELFARHSIPTPRTVIVHAGNADQVADMVGFPCVVKEPDSSFSMGVKKAADAEALRELLKQFFETTELAVVQPFVPTSFDWRVATLGGQPLFVCRYHMAKGHWQIQRNEEKGNARYGKVETLTWQSAPPGVVELALEASALVGDGLYGVDIKELPEGYAVMEINDNPNIESGVEDAILHDALYANIMSYFFERMEERGRRSRT